jgi:phosphate transport system protein
MNEILIDMDLDELKQKLLTMASHAETAVNEALRALLERDYELALRVKESDNVIDQLEVEIDEMAI